MYVNGCGPAMILIKLTNQLARKSILVFGYILIIFSPRVVQAEGPVSHCESFLGPVQSDFIKFKVNFLKFIATKDYQTNLHKHKITEVLRIGTGIFVLEQVKHKLTFNELRLLGVNPYSPFKFFLNGFNTLDEGVNINTTWMFDTAKSYAHRAATAKDSNLLTNNNLMFITWGIPEFLTEDLIQMVPAYFKTIASYKIIMRFVAETLENLIDYVEYHHKVNQFWSKSTARREYYESFQFYGHSLGSHLILDSIAWLRERKPEIRFGKLMGLDPANPCFLSLGDGLSPERLDESIKQLVVLHTNAGLAGLAHDEAHVEIVLNGGTFQPGCSWLDFACHHARSTDILGYIDDQCQMVAYRCSSYRHFKMGACDSSEWSGKSEKDFLLVNLDEQHQDQEDLLDLLDGRQVQLRQLARGAQEEANQNYRIFRSQVIGKRRQRHLEKFNLFSGTTNNRSLNYFVNTNPNFRRGSKSHCLQHYQLHLIVQYPSEKTQQNCPISSFFIQRLEQFRVDLLHEYKTSLRTKDTSSANVGYRADKVIENVLYSSLVTFEGPPKLFVGAYVDNIDWDKLSLCLETQKELPNKELKIVLDIAFMSHTDKS